MKAVVSTQSTWVAQVSDNLEQLYQQAVSGSWEPILSAFDSNGLLARRAARYICPTSGSTFLHQAVLWGHLDAIKALIKYGASSEIADQDGKTPVEVAQEKGHAQVPELLSQIMPSKSAWCPSSNPAFIATSSLFNQAQPRVATEQMTVSYAGRDIKIEPGKTYYIDSLGRVLVGWHGSYDPPCGMDGECMVNCEQPVAHREQPAANCEKPAANVENKCVIM
eukprot:TRINITY_DN2885_c0_g2_i3.p1 TRINITY_DN2885_c0_g2~~TRINITY_DN2885_c0_g2_i3.p1  ORF type:complete len:222 (-),score=31.20 TRINITY_DN2885_c0_g2_i3:16-681(-)